MHTIRCAEVWGGIQNEDLDACSRTVTASLFSQACDGGKGGDIYLLSVCAEDDLTRIAIADVVGHGEAVSTISGGLHDSLARQMNELEGERVLHELNQLVAAQGFHAMTTAAIVGVCRSLRSARFSYAGHHPVLLRQRGGVWREIELERGDGGALANLPLGVSTETVYESVDVPVTGGDRLLLYTDGVIEAADAGGGLYGVARLEAQLQQHAGEPLHVIKAALLDDVRAHGGGVLAHDDVTLLCVEVR